MKCMSKIIASIVACAGVLSCSTTLNAFADVDKSAQTELFSSDPLISFSALGYTPDQIQTLITVNVPPVQYLAYLNYDSNIGYTGSDLTQFEVTRSSFITFNDIARGSLYDISFESGPYFNEATGLINRKKDYVYCRFNKNTSGLNEYQFPNIVRFKYTGSTSLSDFTVSCLQNTEPAFLKGTVEAGNVSRYISGSTDTGSIINSDDATLVLQHFGDMMAGLADPNWTYAASIAADVNCDNQVNALDAMLISNYILDTSNLFWPNTPPSSP